MRGLILRRGALWLALAAVLSCGCSSVTINEPLGKPESIDKDKLEGTWVLDEAAVAIRFSDDGVAQLAGVEWEDGKFRLNRAEMIVNKGKEANYLSFRVEENGKWQEEYVFAQYAVTDQGDLLIWMPDVPRFAAAVKDGRLEGAVKKEKYSENVLVTSPPEKLLKFLEDPANAQAFNYKHPLILRRLGGAAKAAEASAESPQ